MIDQVAHLKAEALRPHWLYKASAAAALILAGLLVIAAIQLVLTVFGPGNTAGWIYFLQNNWLIILFKLQAGFGGIQHSFLSQINLLDIAILALSATIYIGLYAALQKTSKVWSMIALAQPVLGIGLFMITKTAGRSSFMGAELLISIVMLRSKLFDRGTPYLGMLSGALLLAGDLGASMAPSTILAIAVSFGYALVVIWLFLVGTRLLQLATENEWE